jgi:glutaredoxin
MGVKCPQHQLAMGPDGRCVLCRRDGQPAGSVPAPPLDLRTLLRVAAGIAMLVAVAGAAMLWTRRRDQLQAGRSQIISFDVSPVSSSRARAEASAKLPPPLADRLAQAAAETDDGDPGPPRTAEPATTSDASRQTADAGQAPKGPTQEQIRAAIRRVPVSVYTTRTCSVCNSARAFLAANQIPFVEKDVEGNPGYRGELAALNPNRTVPTFVVDGQIVVGFDPAHLARIIGARVERQLGVKLDVRVPKGPR